MDDLEALRAGGKRALARALAMIEARLFEPETAALLDAACAAPRGRIVGLTGPPGVGKSTLIGALIRAQRAQGRTIGVIAVDPSSSVSGGALLGDRARFGETALDQGVFVRSMAARDSLGGVSDLTFPAAVLMAAVYDLVLIETVGVGQSEVEVAGFVERVGLCAQPGAGDSLQFLKAGIMEIPDIVFVTKSDIEALAERTAAELRAASRALSGRQFQVVMVSAETGQGLTEALDKMAVFNPEANTLRNSLNFWIRSLIRKNFGVYGLTVTENRGWLTVDNASFTGCITLIDRLKSALASGLKPYVQ